ncbi:nucleotidyltransferase substrate binding protein [Cyclobacterium sp.]|uniref:nucleotidyltransferase substrate binding protein n=1 Tax=Cyclobacterium sp. TaxID=1966343 RepID=UPI0019A3CC96|nr:nucleotidyltransferase substrate binding protein [Cyclobacterium sp.]MBD3627787.1 nucleotidyltransferase substrate binding protein [Cyclobacterium sp.]
MTEGIRWEQRFSNYDKALNKPSQAVTQAGDKGLSELEVEGLIQRFEYTYELAWKTLQDFIKQQGYTEINGPGQVLNQAFEMGLINNPQSWRRLKKSRELTSHTYDSKTAKIIADAIIKEYYGLFTFLWEKLDKLKSGKTGNLFS